MAYQPYDRTPRGIVFFGENAADQVYESTSGFVYTSGTSTLDVPNINVSTNGTIGGDLTVIGDLNVSGVVNQVNLEELLVEDSSITLRSNFTGTPSASDDASIVVNRGASSDVDIRWDEGTGNGIWKFTNDGSTYYPFFIPGTGITSDGNLDLCGLSTVTSVSDSDEIAICQGGNSVKITRSNLLTGFGAGTVTSVGITSDTLTISGSPITSSGDIDLEVKKDGTTIDLNGSNELQIADGGVTETKISRTIDSSFTTGDTISSDINLVTTGASDLTVNLPTAAEGKIVIIKKIDSGAGNVIISGGSHDAVTDTIDGATSKRLYYQYETLTCVAKTTGTASDVQAWYII
jgi:hypothetical protein